MLEQQGLTKEVQHVIFEKLVVAHMAETDLSEMDDKYRYNIDFTKTILQPCQYKNTNSSECRFINVLAGISAQRGFDSSSTYLGVKRYIGERVLTGNKLTLQSFKDYMEEHYEKVVDDVDNFHLKVNHFKVL